MSFKNLAPGARDLMSRGFRGLRTQWLGALALFLVLAGGGAYAAGKIGSSDIAKNAVRTKHIKNGAVTRAKLADDVKGQTTKISYLADAGGASETIFENEDFRLTAACDNTNGPNLTIRPKSDHGAWSQSVTGLDNGSNVFSGYDQDPDTSVSGPRTLQFFSLPEESGTVTYLSPGGTRVTTITYLANFSFAAMDCAVAGNAVTT
jgi:hypothetical protein